MKRFLVVMAVLVVCGWAIEARATVIFSNLSGESSGIFSSGGLGITAGKELGYEFSVFGDYTLDGVSVALANMSSMLGGGANSVNLKFDFIRSSGGYPDFSGILETFYFSIPESQGIYPILLSASSVLNPSFSSGEYWLVGSFYPQQGGFVNWLENSLADQGNCWMHSEGFPSIVFNFTRGAFSVEGTAAASPVPEPATIILLGSGLLSLLGLKKRREDC